MQGSSSANNENLAATTSNISQPPTQNKTNNAQQESVQQSVISAEEAAQQPIQAEQDQPEDQDAAAFQNMVTAAQASALASQNPFLVQQDVNLPVPTSPMPTLELLYHPENVKATLTVMHWKRLHAWLNLSLPIIKLKRVLLIFSRASDHSF